MRQHCVEPIRRRTRVRIQEGHQFGAREPPARVTRCRRSARALVPHRGGGQGNGRTVVDNDPVGDVADGVHDCCRALGVVLHRDHERDVGGGVTPADRPWVCQAGVDQPPGQPLLTLVVPDWLAGQPAPEVARACRAEPEQTQRCAAEQDAVPVEAAYLGIQDEPGAGPNRLHYMPRVNPSGMSTSSGVRSCTDALPSPYRVESMPWRRISSTLCTPRSPLAAMPHRYARPIITARAPSASAFTTSLPRRIPPSSRISICPPTAL